MTNTNEITTGMGNVALDVVGNEPLAEKNKKKTPGTAVQIVTNMRPVTITKNTPMFKYDVKVMFVYSKADGKEFVKERSKSIFKGPEHERDKGLCSLAYKKAVRQCPELQKGGPFYYDRQASLYSLSLLKKDPLTLNLTGTDLSQKQNFLRVEFTVTKVADSFQSTSNAIKKSVNIRPNLADKTILEALNLMVSGKALEDPNVLTMGNCVHYLYNDDHIEMNRVRVLDGEKNSAVGTCKSVKTLEGRDKDPSLYLTTELKATLFHPDGYTVLDVLRTYPRFNANRQANDAWSIPVRDSLLGLSCYVTYGPDANLGVERRMVKIRGFGLSARQQTFKRDGQPTTVLNYYKEKYNIDLRFPDLFTVVARGREGQSENYPVECLELCPAQPVRTEQMIGNEQSDLIKLAATAPHNRNRITQQVVQSVGLGNDREGYVKVGAPEVVTGYVLPKPTISYGGKTVNWNEPGKRGPATDFNITKFLRPARLVNWEVVFDKNAQLDSAIAPLVNTMKEMGMQVENPQRSFIVSGNLKPIFTEAVKNKRQMLLFITPDNNNYHQEMKALELEHDMLTQDIKFTTAERYVRQPNTRKNIANKINIKLGGLNYDVESKYFDKNRLVIGFETSQKGGGGDAPIAIGFSANMSDHHMKFTGGYYLVKRSSDVYGPIIKDVVKLCIEQTKKNRAAPTSIVVYFSGVNEGQYGLINEKYVGAIKKVCESFSGSYRPHITVIAATKLHNTRLYKQDQRGVSNMEPGTIIDETIVNPLLGEWYNSSAVARQGTNKAAKYTVIFNTDKTKPLEVWEGLTNDLCYDHQIVYHPVSYPAPLYVAGMYSHRGAEVLAQRSAVYKKGEFDFEATNKQLGVFDKKLFATRFNA
ncbi:unnamed protein product [Caenorhabditis brenneri]